MSKNNAPAKITLGNHPEHLKVVDFWFVESQFGEGVMLKDTTNKKWVCWNQVVVEQFHKLSDYLERTQETYPEIPVDFAPAQSASGRTYLMVTFDIPILEE
jgi:hypothetical protein